MARPKGALGKFNAEGKAALAELVRYGAVDLPSMWKRLVKSDPDKALAAWVNAAKHITPPARAALPGENADMPLVVEVRERSVDTDSEASAAAVAAASHHRRVERPGDEGDEDA